ncbi:hypothetical protein BH10ACI2_BH10ACI2_01600 [soil metagenome]
MLLGYQPLDRFFMILPRMKIVLAVISPASSHDKALSRSAFFLANAFEWSYANRMIHKSHDCMTDRNF